MLKIVVVVLLWLIQEDLVAQGSATQPDRVRGRLSQLSSLDTRPLGAVTHRHGRNGYDKRTGHREYAADQEIEQGLTSARERMRKARLIRSNEEDLWQNDNLLEDRRSGNLHSPRLFEDDPVVLGTQSNVYHYTPTELPPTGELFQQTSSACLQAPADDDSVIKAAVLLTNSSEYTISLAKVRPVLKLALAEVYRRHLLPRHISFQFLLKDDRCDAIYSQKATFEAVKQNVHVFFGPACEYSVAPVARTIKFWSTPLLTTGAMTFDFSKDKRADTSEYHLLVRVGLLSFRDMGDFLNALFAKYRWRRVMLVYDKDGCRRLSGKHTCKLMMETLVESFKGRNIHYGYYDLDKNRAQSLRDNLQREVGLHTSYQDVNTVLLTSASSAAMLGP